MPPTLKFRVLWGTWAKCPRPLRAPNLAQGGPAIQYRPDASDYVSEVRFQPVVVLLVSEPLCPHLVPAVERTTTTTAPYDPPQFGPLVHYQHSNRSMNAL